MRVTHVIIIITAAALALSASAGAKAPAAKHTDALYRAENQWGEHHAAKAHGEALRVAEQALAEHDASAVGALARPREALEAQVAEWTRIALRLRYLRAISLRELEQWAEARKAFRQLSEQTLDAEVRASAQDALDRLMEKTATVHIFCTQGRSFHFYPRGSKQKGIAHECSGQRSSNRFQAHPGEYVVTWESAYDEAGRFLEVELGPDVHVHLFDGGLPAAPPMSPGCVSSRF